MGYGYGSEWHLLQHLGRRREAFTRRIQTLTGCGQIEWLDSCEYRQPPNGRLTLREARGLEFLASTDPVRQDWERLWPQFGNVHNWDAIGRARAKSAWILVEAKAHLGELASSCSATSADSRRRIGEVLDHTRRDLGVTGDTDWSRDYYQYSNRIALLQFLRSRSIDAHLVFVYFTGDRADLGAPGRECPPNEAGWQAALERQDQHAGLPPASPIRGAIHRVFLPAYRANLSEQILKPDYIRLPV